jgi:predicted RecB family nuclease
VLGSVSVFLETSEVWPTLPRSGYSSLPSTDPRRNLTVTNVNKTITSEIMVAYAQCPRKAHMLLYSDEKGAPHEYVRILEQRKITNRDAYLISFGREHLNVCPYSIDSLRNGSDFCINVTLQAGVFEAICGILTKVASPSSLGEYSYEPTVFIGTYRISRDQKLELFFVGKVLEQIQGTPPAVGRIVGMGPKLHKVKLEKSGKTLAPLLEDLQEWTQAASPGLLPLILNKHCPYCQFRFVCRAQAEREDNLSLLDRVTTKAVRRYEKKGIFTVKQLSYLYKPRRRKKRTRNPPPAVHKPELQALALRTAKIYLQDLPELTRKPVELFLDLEGVPDQQYDYLIGLLVCDGGSCTYHSFWADTNEDEAKIWQRFVKKVTQYPDAPIYHYGSYESRAVAKLARRHKTDSESLNSRLVNVNTYIYGKVYFPVRSNRLKDIGAFIGATWTSPDASGLQSLVWRYHWDETRNVRYRGLLMTYNREDCQALKSLLDELSRLKRSADALSEVDFVDLPKRHATEAGIEIHSQFEAILNFANASYDKKKIIFRAGERSRDEVAKVKRGGKKGYQGQRKTRPKVEQTVHLSVGKFCPKCGYFPLRPTKKVSKRLIIDLALTENGIKKKITEYIGTHGYCSQCHRAYAPPDIRKYGANRLYGNGFKAFLVYQRVALRLPYESIGEVMEEQFGEKTSPKNYANFWNDFSEYHVETEALITKRLLESPIVHADETAVSIRGVTQYVWVFTDGKHVIFKLRETRNARIVHELLNGYDGTLISDFYPGYDSIECNQQKCWVHLIRDLNHDLWAAPFDTEYEIFVLEVRNLIIPIMETIQEYGLKRDHLGRFVSNVDQFYERVITNKRYRSEPALKYQTRFTRYRDSLFTFLEQDGIPWHNNTAERAIRHLAKQRQISGSFHESGMHDYLVLLGIRQTCRFQGKSFLRFLFSGDPFIIRHNS